MQEKCRKSEVQLLKFVKNPKYRYHFLYNYSHNFLWAFLIMPEQTVSRFHGFIGFTIDFFNIFLMQVSPLFFFI